VSGALRRSGVGCLAGLGGTPWQLGGPIAGGVLDGARPAPISSRAGLAGEFIGAMERSASLHEALAEPFPEQAPYAVSLAYRVRFLMHMNAREAMHVLELRTTPQGHPAYRLVCQEMHRLVAERAGHHAVAAMMRFVDHSTEPRLERLEAERRVEEKRRGHAEGPGGSSA